MSTQAEFNANPNKYILYYCNSTNSDSTLYDTNLSDVCGLVYDTSDNIQIVNWLITGYLAPAISTLLSYSLATVSSFFHSFYEEPIEIRNNQHYAISGSDLAACRVDSSMIGYVVYNSTLQKQQYYNGSTWVSMTLL